MDVFPREIDYYYAPNGSIPYREWQSSLNDDDARTAIDKRLTRVERGLLGDCKSVGNGVYELRVDVGPWYRIYFGQQGRTIILLLSGGVKRGQRKDIRQAQAYWADHLQRRRD